MAYVVALLISFLFMTSDAFSVQETPDATTAAVQAVVKDPLSEDIKAYRALLQGGDLLKAHDALSKTMNALPGGDKKKELYQELYALNMKILFSRTMNDGSTLYEVVPGDTLGKIARKHKTTIALIMQSNGLKDHIIRPGEKLKVITKPFRIVVDKSANKLFLLQGQRTFKVYSVATGKHNSSPVGSYVINSKLENPTWYHAGAIVPPDSPKNILGTRWLGIDYPGYGIHGTTIPESIGTQATSGCVRMLNNEVEELYSIIPYGTKVKIKD
jgi:lipoprotein-anchoring transpeptidase ErfK/SrfK